ncbi:MAG TPA: type III-A CRISPR-associated RAMP protein Csm4 [Chloroflexi bacterium]|nr:type III-A CRISPR-associated RAMP protein Csm4 [Chloroflexota bacterium]
MTEWTIYRFKPKPGAGFHFGLRGLEQEDSAAHCPSDTLFAALVATLGDLEGTASVDRFTAPFEGGTPPFLLTSAFPIAGSLPLLPRPFTQINLTPVPGQRKLLKRLSYVSPAIFRRILDGELMDDYAGEKGAFLQGGTVWIAVGETERLPEKWRALDKARLREQKVWDSTPVDRVAVDRASSASSIYRIGRTTYAPGCGLWAGVQWPQGIDAVAQAQLETLLTYLGDQGLGGERSVGYGQFELKTTGLDLGLPAVDGGRALTLSRYLPRREELPDALQGEAAYRLAPVAGWLGAPGHAARRRRQVRFLVEGAVFETVGAGPWGRLADVRPAGWDGFPIWRYGYACSVGVPARGVSDA